MAALVATLHTLPAPTQEEIYAWCDEGEKRYKDQTPPGFMDAKKKDSVRNYSDLILWKEILKYAKTEAKAVVFVTDDVKADWWESTDDGNTAFHHKLLEEFSRQGRVLFL